MKKNLYLFITYGVKGWRGVQERGLAIAQHFNKNEVLFWNGYDSDFIEKEGFRCKTVDLSLTEPERIKFPKNVKTIIFADLPTNELFNISLFLAAKKKNIPVIVLDQLYRRKQSKEGVYRSLAEYADMLLLNGLEFMKKEETKKIKIIPPLPNYAPQQKIKEEIALKYNLNPKNFWVLVSGYFKPTLEMAKKSYLLLSQKNKNFHFIICGLRLGKPQKKGNQLLLPYLPQKEFLELLDASDIFISKFGFLQILEALSLKTPLIVAGEAGYVLKTEILDKKLQEVIKYAENPKELAEICNSLIKNRKKRQTLSKKISKLHNGILDGAKIAADFIKKLKTSRKIETLPKRKILILINDEIKKAESFISQESYLYVLGIIASVSKPGPKLYPVKRPEEKLLSRKIEELILKQQEILPHTFKEIHLLSKRKYDGLTNIFPWYDIWIKNLISHLEFADEILITPKAKFLFFNLLQPFKKKIKIIKI